MTIDEVIERNRERAEKINEKANEQKGLNYGLYLLYKEHAEEYEQIIEWLKELKELRKQKDKFDENIKFFNEINLKCHNQGYNKAIDDFIKKLEEYEHKNWIDNLEYGITWSDIEQIAKELKECEE